MLSLHNSRVQNYIMNFQHWYYLPLDCLQPLEDIHDNDASNFEGKMDHINLSHPSIFDSPCNTSPVKSPRKFPNVEIFKDLLSSQCEKADMMKENISFLKKEIEVKNKTIDRLMTFIANVIGTNYECVANTSGQSTNTTAKSSTPTKYENVTTRRRTNGVKLNVSIASSENSVGMDCDDFQDEPKEPIGVRISRELQNVRQEKHAKFTQEHSRTVVTEKENRTNINISDSHDKVDDDINNSNDEINNNNDSNNSSNNNNNTEDQENPVSEEKINDWEKHTNGFARKELSKYGYQGKGLGKREDGITQPIEGVRKVAFDDDVDSHDLWPNNTVLFAGDSMYNQIDERRIANSLMGKFKVKVRAHPGATVGDMRHHLAAWLRKKPSHVVIHVCTNDTTNTKKSAKQIYDELVELKTYAESLVPGVKVVISCPIVRRDDKAANVKCISIRAMLRASTSAELLLTNENIGLDLLGKKGLHLLFHKGVGRLAKNMIEHLQSL